MTLDQAQRLWVTFSEVEQGSLLVELSASIRRRLMHAELDRPLAEAYRVFAYTARTTGNAMIHRAGVPVRTPSRCGTPLWTLRRRGRSWSGT